MEAVQCSLSYIGDGDSWLNDPCWSLDYRHKDEDFIYSGLTERYGRLLILRSLYSSIDLDELFTEMHHRISNASKWNPDMAFYGIINRIGPNADIIMGISRPLLGGLVHSREFVDARYLRRLETTDGYIWAQCSIAWGEKPNSGRVRANDVLSCVRVRRLPQVNKLEMIWMTRMEMNGNIPSFLNDRATRQILMNFAHQFRPWLRKIGVVSQVDL